MSVTSSVDGAGSGWSIVVPVKQIRAGKSRLAPYLGRHRPELALAMTLDTVQSALDCTSVTEIVAVTSDPLAGAELAALGAVVVPDEPDHGLNPALAHGVDVARSRSALRPVATLSSDLPALRPSELETVLTAASNFPSAFVPDAIGTGTTMYTVLPGVPFRPRFGTGSRALHAAGGAVELDLAGIWSIRHDVDTEADLFEAVGLGIGERTRGVLAALGAVL